MAFKKTMQCIALLHSVFLYGAADTLHIKMF